MRRAISFISFQKCHGLGADGVRFIFDLLSIQCSKETFQAIKNAETIFMVSLSWQKKRVLRSIAEAIIRMGSSVKLVIERK